MAETLTEAAIRAHRAEMEIVGEPAQRLSDDQIQAAVNQAVEEHEMMKTMGRAFGWERWKT